MATLLSVGQASGVNGKRCTKQWIHRGRVDHGPRELYSSKPGYISNAIHRPYSHCRSITYKHRCADKTQQTIKPINTPTLYIHPDMLPSIALTALLPLLLPFTYAAPSPPADPAALAARGPGDVWINSATIVTADTNRLKLRKGDKSKIDMNEHASSLVNLPIGQDEGEVGFVVWTKKEGAEVGSDSVSGLRCGVRVAM